MIEMDDEGWEGLDDLGREVLALVRTQAETAVTRAAYLYRGAVQQRLLGRRSGRQYVVSKTGRLHVASAAGSESGVGAESPANLTGTLARSISVGGPQWSGWEIAASVGTNVAYARRLEYGGVSVMTKTVPVQVAPGQWRTVKAGTQIRILPRPYFEPAFRERLSDMERVMDEAINPAGGD